MRLHLYFARRFATTFAGLLAAFAIFAWLVELLEHIRRFDAGATGFAQLAYMAVLRLPVSLYQILPLIVLLTAVSMFLGLARSSEMVIARATGRSALISLAAPVIAALMIGALAVGLGNPFVATLSQTYEGEENRLRGIERVVAITDEGLWLRQGRIDRQTAIHGRSANLDGTRLFDVTFYVFDRRNRPLSRIDGAEAELANARWLVRDAKQWDFTGPENPEAAATSHDQLAVPTDLTRDQIRDSFGTPSAIPIWDLPTFIDRLERAGFSARSHRVFLQAELAKPLSFVAMVLIGAVFTLRHTRFGRTGLMVLGAVLAGFATYFVANLAQVMGDSGQLPVAVAIWGPQAAAICLALAMLLHLEDG